jgi:hypothetical protein
VLEALKPWNLDCIRHTSGFRMNRKMYANAWLPTGPFEVGQQTQQFWSDALNAFGECDITDRGGAKDTPFLYALQRGRFSFAEVDNYPDPTDPEGIMKAAGFGIYGMARLVKEKICPCLMAFLSVEPFTTMFPEVGPNQQLLFRKIRKVFDPKSVDAPGRQVYTEEEWKNAPEDLKQLVNKMRQMVGLESVQ